MRMIRLAFLSLMLCCYHVGGKQIIPDEMRVVESEDEILNMLYKKIAELDAKLALVEMKNMELERQISELERHPTGKDVMESNLSTYLAYTRPEIKHNYSQRIGFFATVRHDSTGYLGRNQVIIFDNVVTNFRSAYNGLHGYFFAPVAGTYAFFVSIGEKYGTGMYYIVADGVVRGRFQAGGTGHQASQNLVITLKKNSHVAVKNGDYAYDKVRGDYHTTFSGFLLW